MIKIIEKTIEKGIGPATLTGALIGHWAGNTVILHPDSNKEGTAVVDPGRKSYNKWYIREGLK